MQSRENGGIHLGWRVDRVEFKVRWLEELLFGDSMACDENYVDRGMVDDVRKFWKLKVWWIDCEVDVWELNAKKECLKKKKKKDNNNFILSHFSFHWSINFFLSFFFSIQTFSQYWNSLLWMRWKNYFFFLYIRKNSANRTPWIVSVRYITIFIYFEDNFWNILILRNFFWS